MASIPLFHGQDVVGTLGLGRFRHKKFTEEETNQLMDASKKIAQQIADSGKNK